MGKTQRMRRAYMCILVCLDNMRFGCMMKVEFGGSTGRVAFDQFGRRRNYQLDVLEQRGDHEPAKVRSFLTRRCTASPALSRCIVVMNNICVFVSLRRQRLRRFSNTRYKLNTYERYYGPGKRPLAYLLYTIAPPVHKYSSLCSISHRAACSRPLRWPLRCSARLVKVQCQVLNRHRETNLTLITEMIPLRQLKI